MSGIEWLGIIAGLLTTFALAPQIIRVYKLKHAQEISLPYTTTMFVGVIVWLVYGIMQGLVSLIIWNTIGSILNAWLLFAKLKYGK